MPVGNAEGNAPGLIAYGLYKVAKREWVEGIRARHGRGPTAEELDAYAATWTDSMLTGLRERADSTLAAFGNVVVSEATPSIREDALRGSTGKAISTSIAANALYTLILIALALILAWSGVDLIGLVQKAKPPA
ncbi:hypothetical protein ACTHAX_19920 [Methylobacterium fujisawaense]